MKNGKFKTFRSKDAYESWRRGMFGRMGHEGKIRFVSREEQAKARIGYKKKEFSKEKDVTGRSQIISGRVKAHGSSVKIQKKKGESKATGYREQSTSTDNFIVAETEEAGKYTPLNTELSIEEVDDDIIITRTSKSDGRVISTTVIRAASPEGINTFFLDLEDRFSDNKSLKLWELRALADHFNIRSGGITIEQLEGRIRRHMEGTLDSKYYTNPKSPTEGIPEEELSDEERRDQAEALGYNIPKPDTTPIETPFTFEKTQKEADVLRKAEKGTLIDQSAAEQSIMELVASEPENIIEDTMDDKTLNSPEEGGESLFDEALNTSKPLIQSRESRSRSTLSRGFSKFPDQANDQRYPVDEIFEQSNNRQPLIDEYGNTFSFYKDPQGEVKLTKVTDMQGDNLANKFDKEQIMEKFNISGDFDIDYNLDKR